MSSRLANQWVLITGASSGFGAAGALAFAAEGSRLLLGARRVERLESVAAAARQAGAPEALFHPLDVASTESVNAFAAWAGGRAGRVDVLVNNAGGAHGLEPIGEGRDEDWETMMQSNVLGVLRMTRAILPWMRPHPGGCIINVGSIAATRAYEGGAAYCGAKAAAAQITRVLRLELCGSGLRVCSLDPGMAETEFSMVRFKGDAVRAGKVYEGVQPLTGGDVAEAMVWMAGRPPHVCIDEIVIKPTAQADIHKVFRRPSNP